MIAQLRGSMEQASDKDHGCGFDCALQMFRHWPTYRGNSCTMRIRIIF